MQVNLNQTALLEAVSLYLNKEGIQTKNKVVTTTFKMGRKNSGLSATVVLEPMDLPDLGPDEPVRPVLRAVTAENIEASDEVGAEDPDTQNTATAATTTKASLFN